MIHQLIFAAPRPGMSEEEFQRYWVDVHAVKYASKIPQIRRYLIDTRVPLGPDEGEPLWNGVAEIWLENEQEQLASLQTPEFLDGARADEPRWAAFWRTLVLDTDEHVLREPPVDASGVKVLELVKRRSGMPLDEFRRRMLEEHGPLVLDLPGLRGCVQCHVRDALYGIGEATLDMATLTWFDDVDSARKALAAEAGRRVERSLRQLVEPRYVHRMAGTEHWIIGPEARRAA